MVPLHRQLETGNHVMARQSRIVSRYIGKTGTLPFVTVDTKQVTFWITLNLVVYGKRMVLPH